VSYIGSSAMAQHGWAYGAHPRRLLVFSLDGKAEPPQTVPPKTELLIVDNSEQVIDSAQAAAGEELYLPRCLGCHGFAAISGGGAPDLRASAVAADLESFGTVLRTGQLQARGMPMFDELNDRQVEQIYWYIRQRARESLKPAL
jgi:quinohemoprotein ethanol dehydrogenase